MKHIRVACGMFVDLTPSLKSQPSSVCGSVKLPIQGHGLIPSLHGYILCRKNALYFRFKQRRDLERIGLHWL